MNNPTCIIGTLTVIKFIKKTFPCKLKPGHKTSPAFLCIAMVFIRELYLPCQHIQRSEGTCGPPHHRRRSCHHQKDARFSKVPQHSMHKWQRDMNSTTSAPHQTSVRNTNPLTERGRWWSSQELGSEWNWTQ